MKKLLLLLAGLSMAGAASAEWGTTIDSPVDIFPAGTLSYATCVKTAPDGSVWALLYHPNLKEAAGEEDISNVVYEYRLQHFDKNGNPTFDKDGILISDYNNMSYTVVNDYLLVDSESNAIVSVADSRNSESTNRSYTAYKVSPTGEMLWDEDGIPVSDAMNPATFAACMQIVELDDHSYVFAWMEMNANQEQHIRMQRLSNAGDAQWDPDQVDLGDDVTTYPYLVPSGGNTFILVYARSASMVLYARKIDFEGESVWGKDTRIYRGGWGSIPPHLQIGVRSSGNGGVLVSWTDDRTGINIESPYISYVTSDGKLGFEGISDEADVKLSYDENRCFNVAATPAADGSCFYAIWRRTDNDQRYQAIMMQKISLQGELLWGDNAKELFPNQVTSLGYTSIQPAGESDAVGFFEQYRDYFDQQCFAARFDKDGNMVWDDGILAISEAGRQATSLESQQFPGEDAYLVNWTYGGSSAEDDVTTYVMTYLNEDGSIGKKTVGIAEVNEATEGLSYSGDALKAPLPDGSRIEVYDATGAHAASFILAGGEVSVGSLASGLYIASTKDSTIKFIVK